MKTFREYTVRQVAASTWMIRCIVSTEKGFLAYETVGEMYNEEAAEACCKALNKKEWTKREHQ